MQENNIQILILNPDVNERHNVAFRFYRLLTCCVILNKNTPKW